MDRWSFTDAKVAFTTDSLQKKLKRVVDDAHHREAKRDETQNECEENNSSNTDAIHATQAQLTQPTNPPIVAIA